MIQLSKNYSPPDRLTEFVPVKVVSVGGAGLNALDRIVLDGLEKASVVAINTDVQSLTSSVAAHKVQLGRNITRGLGTGGDPELGYDAAVESADEIREALADARMIFVCAGLGGGTGSGAAPYVAQLAREAGALVIGFVTLPFTFEGKRRNVQAREALARLSEVCHSVICFENDRMGDLVSPQAGIHQAFAMADTTISQSVRSVVNLIQRPGLIRIGFDDLLAALRTHNGRCLFGFGEAIVRFSKKIPRDPTNNRLIDQVVGCGTSIGGNYCEANEGVSKKDFRNMISRCVKESKETKFFLRMLAASEPQLADEAREHYREAKELHLIFASIFRKTRGEPL